MLVNLTSRTFSFFTPSEHDGAAIEVDLTFTRPEADEIYHNIVEFDQKLAIIYLHPYPPLVRLEKASSAGCTNLIPTLCATINHRGAGKSEGKNSWTGAAEVKDLETLLTYLLGRKFMIHKNTTNPDTIISEYNEKIRKGPASATSKKDNSPFLQLIDYERVLIVGYSYGSMIASGIDMTKFLGLDIGLVLIGYPFSVSWALSLFRSSAFTDQLEMTILILREKLDSSKASGKYINLSHVLMISGDHDDYTSAQVYKTWWEKFEGIERISDTSTTHKGNKLQVLTHRSFRYAFIEGADHFFYKRDVYITNNFNQNVIKGSHILWW
ncbi:hypothetical protein AX774_g549 [Zancudomyces culisetae]|uniref:AB hydrolase-1 domain-containing protein n=1 Tax=Zancudomyces culisetae TaxID=1213189 RepID=A0A1R1PY61_ZANCU|nr:hypothetical protein AX774_g549 [Zancudomyces culisetae]|eukprot:OMH85904.1 hypothetical protein AX774_g549 [Zancudomyces culisetae]